MLDKIEIVKPAEIEKRSMEIITSELNGRTWPEPEFSIVKRCIHTSADFDYADNLCFSENAAMLGVEALRRGAVIVTDTRMAWSGINKKKLAEYGGEAFCFMSDADVAQEAKDRGCTRAAICMERGAALGKEVIFAVGNAPTALIRLYELIKAGEVKPALIIGAPIGILSAVFLAFYCPKKIYPVLKSGVQLLAGIPSVVYGFFGLMVLVPFVREVFGGRGLSVLTASVLLGMMILPTIISVSESSIRAVNTSYYEGSVGLGATHERSIFRCVLPACKSGIMTGVVLGLGRAIGETMAVIMVAGNQAAIPKALTDGVRTMTTNIVMEMGYAVDLHRQALIGTAVVLFIFILIINFLLAILKRGDQQND